MITDKSPNDYTTTGIITASKLIGRKVPRIQNIVSSTSITPNSDTDDMVKITALVANTTFQIPSGTLVDGQVLTIQVKSDATPRNLVFIQTAGGYANGGTALPTITVALKTMSMLFVADTNETLPWRLRSVAQEA